MNTTLKNMIPSVWYLMAAIVFIMVPLTSVVGLAQDSDAELAKELTNPLADLMTIPIQMNYDSNIGAGDEGSKLQTNVQPVIPFSMNQDWNIITRTIIPVIWQEDIYPDAGSQFGLGDISLSLFFSPKKSTSSGLMWGAGPILLLPTATDTLLGADQWGAGPTAVALKMSGPVTYGVLGNHIWSCTGSSKRSEINSSFVQPFVSYTLPSALTFSVQSETTYDWYAEQWSIPVNFSVAKMVRFGNLPVSLQAGVGRWLESRDSGPDGWRFRLQANFVLPNIF